MIYYFTFHNKESCALCLLWRFLCHFCVKVFSSYENSWECNKCYSFGEIYASVTHVTQLYLMFWEKNWHIKCSCLNKENPFSVSGFSHSLSPGIIFFPSAYMTAASETKKKKIAYCFLFSPSSYYSFLFTFTKNTDFMSNSTAVNLSSKSLQFKLTISDKSKNSSIKAREEQRFGQAKPDG